MRYNSSKAMMRSGACDNRGFLVGGCSDGHFTSQAPKPLAAKSPKATSTKSCSESTTRASTGGKSPKELSPEYRQLGQTKHGSKADGTDACHILSHEVLNTVLKHTPGRAFGERQQEHIAREINSDANLRQKTRDGNMYGSDGYSGDRYYDGQIIEAIESTTRDGKILTNQKTVDRVERMWTVANEKLNLPPSVKQALRDQLSQLRDHDGRVIIRAN